MRARYFVLSIIALAIAAACVRLGVWQLHRLAEVRARNDTLLSRFSAEPVSIDSLAPNAVLAPGTRVRLTGTLDPKNELVLIHRSRDGAPGVNFLTPMHPAGGGLPVMVNRGWAYSPDGATVDTGIWRPGGLSGRLAYVQASSSPISTTGDTIHWPRAVRRFTGEAPPGRLPYRVRPQAVALLADSVADGEDDPIGFAGPSLSEGSHRSYALQWFSFAAIALVGTGAVIVRDKRGSGV